MENSKKEEVPYYALCNALLKEVTDESHNNKRVEMHNQEVERRIYCMIRAINV